MKIQLKDWKVKNLSFEMKDPCVSNGKAKANTNTFSFNHAPSFSTEDKKEFIIGFFINVKNDNYNIEIEIMFLFGTDEEITEEFKTSQFMKVNAPAIAFPYVRSYISNLTLQSGFPPAMLPSVNFVELAKRNENEVE